MNTASRRDFAKSLGGLFLGFSFTGSAAVELLTAAPESAAVPPPNRLDSWIRIDASGTVTVFADKVDIGTGIETALGQIVAEELDIPLSRVYFVMGDTARTPDQGGTGGSLGIMLGAPPLRNVAATARFLLVQRAAVLLSVPAAHLVVKDGVVSVASDPSNKVSYGVLAASEPLNDELKVTGAGASTAVQGKGTPKLPAAYSLVGTSQLRVDLPAKLFGTFKWVTDVRVEGMLHARAIRPSGVATDLVGVDDAAAKRIPGFVKTVVKGNFVAVVAQSEWAAVRASRAIRATWKPGIALPADLYQHMRTVTPKATRIQPAKGDAASALSNAAKKITASYDYPFHSHATMGPGCAVADFKADGITTIWTGMQKTHAGQKGLAAVLGIPPERLRLIWMQDAGSYGRCGHEDAASDAAVLSQAIGKPVRVQFSRADLTAWGSKGPAGAFDCVGALNAGGDVTAIQFTSHVFSGNEVNYVPQDAGGFLTAQLTGSANVPGGDELVQWGGESAQYNFPNISSVSHVVPPFAPTGSPLRTAHIRDPGGPMAAFAIESFMDELAAAAGADPVQFRLKYLTDPRAKAVIQAAADKAGWETRPSPKTAGSEIVTGRGIAFGVRLGSRVATVAEVEVDRKTGTIRVKKLTCAHDCGLIINPEGIRAQIQGNLMQSMSRALFEEVRFDETKVTSVDWNTYPIAMSQDTPEMEIVLINHPEVPSSGAGEPSTRPTAAAIANAIFDATGERRRRVPLARGQNPKNAR